MVSPSLICGTFQASMRVSGASSICQTRSLRVGSCAAFSSAAPSTPADCAGSGSYYQVGFEAIIPVNRDSGTGVGFLGQFHLYLDDIFPKTYGQPLIGGTSPEPGILTF